MRRTLLALVLVRMAGSLEHDAMLFCDAHLEACRSTCNAAGEVAEYLTCAKECLYRYIGCVGEVRKLTS